MLFFGKLRFLTFNGLDVNTGRRSRRHEICKGFGAVWNKVQNSEKSICLSWLSFVGNVHVSSQASLIPVNYILYLRVTASISFTVHGFNFFLMITDHGKYRSHFTQKPLTIIWIV